jgi:hypothetical protein
VSGDFVYDPNTSPLPPWLFSTDYTPGGNAIVTVPDQPGTYNPYGDNGQLGGDVGTIPMPGGPTPPGTPRTPAEANPNAFFDIKQFLIWLAAGGVLWLILSMLADSGNERIAYSLAALILGGAVIYMGPKAIENAQTLFK